MGGQERTLDAAAVFTALASSTEPGKTFGELPDGRVGPALTFALLAETLAVGSLASLAALSASG